MLNRSNLDTSFGTNKELDGWPTLTEGRGTSTCLVLTFKEQFQCALIKLFTKGFWFFRTGAVDFDRTATDAASSMSEALDEKNARHLAELQERTKHVESALQSLRRPGDANSKCPTDLDRTRGTWKNVPTCNCLLPVELYHRVHHLILCT